MTETKDKTTPVPDLAGCTRDQKIERMVAWFFENFEDPAERTPYESAEGGYIFIWGVTEAKEELDDAFHEHVSEDLITIAVDKIEEDGVDWVPVPHPSDYE